jgi:hypothetical protein
MKFSKVDIAVIQFESAINAYMAGMFVESITLAGAAEEILGKMCKLRKSVTALNSLYEVAKKHDINLDEKKFLVFLNKHRNALKHFDVDKDFIIEINIDDAKAMLVRATINYLQLGLKPTLLVKNFIAHLTLDNI